MSVFALRDLDLSKIESRPVRGKPWEYRFYVDVLSGDEPAMKLALKHLEEIAGFVKGAGGVSEGEVGSDPHPLSPLRRGSSRFATVLVEVT